MTSALDLIQSAKVNAYAALQPLMDYQQNTPAWLRSWKSAWQFCDVTIFAHDRITGNPVPVFDRTPDRAWARRVLDRLDSPFSPEESAAIWTMFVSEGNKL